MRLLNFKKKLFFVCVLSYSIVLESSEEGIRLARRIQAHLTIQDYLPAIEESQKSVSLYPQSSLLQEGYIRSLAKIGDEKKMLQAWDMYVQRFPEKKLNRELIEEMAWGVLLKASHSSSIIMRDMALIAAYFSRDAKGVSILYQGMRDSNYAIRADAVKLGSHFRDHRLTEEVKKLFYTEKVWAVRQQVLEAIGKMKIMSLKGDLQSLIASEESLAAEKALAIASLLELLDSIHREEVLRLSSSNRGGLRQLACKAIAHFQSIRDVDLLFMLSKDPNPDVRLEAFQAIGQLRPSLQEGTILQLARQGSQDINYKVALSSAWLLTLYSPYEGQRVIEQYLHSTRHEVCVCAAAALAAAGRYGNPLILDQFHSHSDPFVRLNLTLGLIGQRQATEEAGHYLSLMLMVENEKWSKVKVGIFEAITNKSTQQGEDTLTSIESDNQLLRLELLNLLAIIKAPNTEQAIRQYLNERSWEISATAAILLLTEGNENAVDIVQKLLQDEHPRVRLQAALILSLWSREDHAIQILEEGYAKSDWEMKGKILEGIGRIGSIRSIPFLIQVLKEPSQTLRLIGSMALIQCLNH